jgi:hypothetical protein
MSVEKLSSFYYYLERDHSQVISLKKFNSIFHVSPSPLGLLQQIAITLVAVLVDAEYIMVYKRYVAQGWIFFDFDHCYLSSQMEKRKRVDAYKYSVLLYIEVIFHSHSKYRVHIAFLDG